MVEYTDHGHQPARSCDLFAAMRDREDDANWCHILARKTREPNEGCVSLDSVHVSTQFNKNEERQEYHHSRDPMRCQPGEAQKRLRLLARRTTDEV